MVKIHVCVLVQVAKGEDRNLRRSIDLPFIPRIGDCLCSESWGLSLIGAGGVVKSVGIDLDDESVYVWLAIDRDSWRDIPGEWRDVDQMLAECYRGFTEF